MRARLLISLFAVATLATVAWIASHDATAPPDVEPVATVPAAADSAAHLELIEPVRAIGPERAPDARSREVAETDAGAEAQIVAHTVHERVLGRSLRACRSRRRFGSPSSLH